MPPVKTTPAKRRTRKGAALAETPAIEHPRAQSIRGWGDWHLPVPLEAEVNIAFEVGRTVSVIAMERVMALNRKPGKTVLA